MPARISSLWEHLQGSYWFVPTIMAAAAVLLSVLLGVLDQAVQDETLQGLEWIYAGGPDGARQLLAAVAGSTITVAGVVFSVAIVAMSLASTQFGPRLLRSFMRDTGNQVTLGTFIATFLYSLLVLRNVRGGDGLADNSFVPHISVTVGVLLTVASVGVLIFFIHHAAASIQAANVIARVSKGLHHAVDQLYPEEIGTGASPSGARHAGHDAVLQRMRAAWNEGAPLLSQSEGYLESVDEDGLLKAAEQEDVLVGLVRRPGDFLFRDGELARVWPADRLTDKLRDRLRGSLVLGEERSEAQDPRFLVQQLVEVAVRALSTGINDPVTAMSCLDRLGGGLALLAGRDQPPAVRLDESGLPRLVAPPVTFAELVGDAFTEIRRHARDELSVTVGLLATIAALAPFMRRSEDVEALMRQVQLVDAAGFGDPSPLDGDTVREAAAEAMRVLRAAHERVGSGG